MEIDEMNHSENLLEDIRLAFARENRHEVFREHEGRNIQGANRGMDNLCAKLTRAATLAQVGELDKAREEFELAELVFGRTLDGRMGELHPRMVDVFERVRELVEEDE